MSWVRRRRGLQVVGGDSLLVHLPRCDLRSVISEASRYRQRYRRLHFG